MSRSRKSADDRKGTRQLKGRMSSYEGSKVLVAGGTGLIGRPLVEMLIERGARVRVVSLDDPSRAHPSAEFLKSDLTQFTSCREACAGMQFVFNLVGVKGSPAAAAARPASFLVPTLVLNTNLLEAARLEGAERFLYTSSVGVYAPAEILREDDVWKSFPSPNDRFAGWAKRMGELQVEAYRIEYGWKRIAVVRPANVYGPFDNFESENAMVIPSLIRRVVSGEDPLTVWGDGSPRRDFVHARDVARGMLLAMEQCAPEPLNLGSGVGVSIRELVQVILGGLESKPRVVWDTARPSGDSVRVMDISRARSLGYRPEITLEAGVRSTMEWYRLHREDPGKRYDVFRSGPGNPLLT